MIGTSPAAISTNLSLLRARCEVIAIFEQK
jgi:hypothetical protein